LREVDPAARAIGLQIQVLKASTSHDIEAAFQTLCAIAPMPSSSAPTLFFQPACPLVNLASRHAIPAIYSQREFADVGGLMGYGASVTDAYRQAGVYAGRILKGSQPASCRRAGEQVRVGSSTCDARSRLTVPDKLPQPPTR